MKAFQNHLKREKPFFPFTPGIRVRMNIFARIRIRKKMRIRNPGLNSGLGTGDQKRPR